MAKWVPMREAAAILKAEGFKVSPNTISRLGSRGIIQTKDDPIDSRVRLVDLEELRRLFINRRGEFSDNDDDEE